MSNGTSPLTQHISRTVHRLRRERGWTQRELSSRIGLSQARLSELERGKGSFTAEQLLTMLGLFNVSVDAFDPNAPSTYRFDASLQNALARLGAHHLRVDPDVRVPSQYGSAGQVIAHVLRRPANERMVTALAPVLVWSIHDVSAPAIQAELVDAGVPGRLPWLVESCLVAWGKVGGSAPIEWRRRGQRAQTVLEPFLARLPAVEQPDPLDWGIRSPESLEKAWEDASDAASRWHIATQLKETDFERALADAMREGA